MPTFFFLFTKNTGENKFSKMKKYLKIFIAFVIIVSVSVASFFVYVSDYYEADLGEAPVFAPTDNISVNIIDDKTIVYMPEGAEIGLIFYPGGKVENTAYIPLMKACASRGIACVLLEMPFNLAVLDVNGADGIQEMYPEITEWYIGGHSLGGSMAATYASQNSDDFNGLVLLGAYSTTDISDGGMKVLSVYGSEDKVLNKEKYIEYKPNLPENFTEVVIEGGCHAYFGMYGEQEGDGVASISNQEQIEKTADAICEFIK